MLAENNIITTVLGHYLPLVKSRQVERVISAQSFSGAQLWRVSTADRTYLLRRWPDDSDNERIAAIHSVLRHVDTPLNGLVAAPITTSGGMPYVSCDGSFWTLSPWLNGQAEANLPVSQKKIENALQALAKFHQAAKSYSKHDYFPAPGVAVPTGIHTRHIKLISLLNSGCRTILAAENSRNYQFVNELRQELVSLFLASAPQSLPAIKQATLTAVPLQICLRDVWRAHVLFCDDEVTGIIDYDALRTDSVATDIARLLGSMAGNETNLWQAGLVAYGEIRPLAEQERRLIEAYDRSAVLLTGLQWLEWILLEKWEFPNPDAVHERLIENLARLRHLSNTFRFDDLVR